MPDRQECWVYQMCSGSSNSILIHPRRNLGMTVWLKPWTGSCSTHKNVSRSSSIVQGPGSRSFWIFSCSWHVNLDSFSCSRYNSNTHLNILLSRVDCQTSRRFYKTPWAGIQVIIMTFKKSSVKRKHSFMARQISIVLKSSLGCENSHWNIWDGMEII